LFLIGIAISVIIDELTSRTQRRELDRLHLRFRRPLPQSPDPDENMWLDTPRNSGALIQRLDTPAPWAGQPQIALRKRHAAETYSRR
jgi:hypothetical protein